MRVPIVKFRGFTLIEIMIVMAIIGMLSVLAIGGYSSYKKGVIVNLTAKSIISQISGVKSRVIYGTSGQQGAVCLGYEFVRPDNGVNYEVKYSNWQFSNKKIWQNDAWEYQGCESTAEMIGKMDLAEGVHIYKISYGDGNVENEAENSSLRFLPPSGKSEFFLNGNKNSDAGILNIYLRYGEDEAYQQKVIIDLKNEKS